MSTPTPLSYYDLVEQFAEPGCALCHLLLRDESRYLGSLMYEYVMEYDIHQTFRASRGLCNTHGWQMTQYGNALGVAVLHQSALDELLTVLERNTGESAPNALRRWLSSSSGGQAGLASAIAPEQACLVCEHRTDGERRYARVFSDHLKDERFQTALRASDGLCLTHFRLMLEHVPVAEDAKMLVDIQTGLWRELQGELAEFIRKSDFQHVKERMGVEGDSWKRVIARLSGEPGMTHIRRPKG